MESPLRDKRIQVLNAPWNNHSHTSIHTSSDTATFHSAHDVHRNIPSQQMELQALKNQSSQHPIPSSPTLAALEKPRKDSGFSETVVANSGSSSRRTSTSTSRSSNRRTSPSRSKRRAHQGQSNAYSSRPTTRRAAKSSPQTAQIRSSSAIHCHRPRLNSRHTIPYPSTPPNNAVSQFFHFPSLPTPDSSPQSQPPPPPPPPPPATVHYWTSDNTRRLEYAAIDAASRGIRGFVTRLVPDCLLPKEFRRTKFCDGDEGSDAGSVRRYRLDLPQEEDEDETKSEKVAASKPGFFRRWSGGFKRVTG